MTDRSVAEIQDDTLNEECPHCHSKNTTQDCQHLLTGFQVGKGTVRYRIYECTCNACGKKFQAKYYA